MTKGTLITQSGLELPCVVFPTRRFICYGQEVTVYCQNRLIKGFISIIDDNMVAEVEVLVNWCIIPELDEMLFEQKS